MTPRAVFTSPPGEAAHRRTALLVGSACVMACLTGLLALPARAIPAFSRQHRLECRSCHTAIPQLNPVGEEFRELGYRLPPALQTSAPEEREAEYRTGLTPTRRLGERIFGTSPFSLRLAGDLRHQSRADPQTRLFWDELLLNVGAGRRRWSYYAHQHLHKGGRGGREPYAVWVQRNDVIRTKRHTASLQAGLFELELGLSPHISRLSSLGYLPYATAIGEPGNFTLGEPELGLQLRGRVEPDWRYTVAVVTGSGLRTENNADKDLFLRVAHDPPNRPALGLFVYTGRRELRRDGRSYENDLLRLGLDARWRPVRVRDLHLFGLLVWGSDDRVFAAGQFREVESLAAALGADCRLGRATILHTRLERLNTNLPQGQQDLWRAVAGVHYMILQDFRISLEGAFADRRRQPDEVQLFLGGMWAF